MSDSEKRTLRPRRKVATSTSYSHERSERRDGERPQRSFNREGGERPQRSYGEPRNYGERPQRNFGEHRTYGNNNERRDSEHRSYGDRPQRPYGERRSFSGGEGRRDGEHRSYGDKPQRPYGERRSFSGEEGRPSGERRSYGDRPQRGGYGQKGSRRPFKRNDTGFNDRDEQSINKMISRRPALDASKYSDFDGAKIEAKDEIRLNKFIANSGVCSRREADTLIQAGVVTVNGVVVTELGTKVNIYNDEVKFNGERLKGEEKVYIVMNKPKGYVTTASDPHADKTVMDLIKGCSARVFPVGRLDKATTGVLMFTNDGEMAEKLTHPAYDKKKIYQVILDHELQQEDYDKILAGIALSDGEIAADELEYIDENDRRKLGIEIHSGKNRIVRRIFESLGYDVRALDRVYFAGLTKKGLQKGEWRYLSEGEINILKMGAYI